MRLSVSTGEPASSGSYAVHFHFLTVLPEGLVEPFSKGMLPPDLIAVVGVRECYCTIHLGDCAKPQRPCETKGAHTGIAKCSPKDNFNRYTGRKIAFTRAVQSYPRTVRMALWDAYLTRCPPPPTRPTRKRGATHEKVGGIQGGIAA
jgi:hypothetical protein